MGRLFQRKGLLPIAGNLAAAFYRAHPQIKFTVIHPQPAQGFAIVDPRHGVPVRDPCFAPPSDLFLRHLQHFEFLLGGFGDKVVAGIKEKVGRADGEQDQREQEGAWIEGKDASQRDQ